MVTGHAPELAFTPRRYECVRCGKCCSELTGLHLTQRDAQRVPFRRLASPHPLFRSYVPLASLRCPHLDASLCAVHDDRPLLCRLFPFRLWATPDGRPRVSMFRCPGTGAGPMIGADEVRTALDDVVSLEGDQFLHRWLDRCSAREREPLPFICDTVAAPPLRERFLRRVVEVARSADGPARVAVLRSGLGLIAALEAELAKDYREPDAGMVDALDPSEVAAEPSLVRVDWERGTFVRVPVLPPGTEPDRDALLDHADEVVLRRGREGLVDDTPRNAVRLLSLLLGDLAVHGGTTEVINERDRASGSVLEALRELL